MAGERHFDCSSSRAPFCGSVCHVCPVPPPAQPRFLPASCSMHRSCQPPHSLPALLHPCSFDEFGRPRKKESAADREAREKAALDRLNVSCAGRCPDRHSAASSVLHLAAVGLMCLYPTAHNWLHPVNMPRCNSAGASPALVVLCRRATARRAAATAAAAPCAAERLHCNEALYDWPAAAHVSRAHEQPASP